MKTATLVVLTKPVDGMEDEYNAWYTGRHLDDVLNVPGFKAAQRFKMVGNALEGQAWPYCALYQVEHDDLDEAIAGLVARRDTDVLPISSALDQADMNVILYEPITELKSAGS